MPPGPDVARHTPIFPVALAYAPAMNAAASSWCTRTNRTRSALRRRPSMIPLIPSPGSPNTVSTPQSASRATSTSAAIAAMPARYPDPPGTTLIVPSRAPALRRGRACDDPRDGREASPDAPRLGVGHLGDDVHRLLAYAARGTAIPGGDQRLRQDGQRAGTAVGVADPLADHGRRPCLSQRLVEHPQFPEDAGDGDQRVAARRLVLGAVVDVERPPAVLQAPLPLPRLQVERGQLAMGRALST